ncbi:MAG: hypothetical protein ACPLW6_07395 [Desulfurella sp.]|jgi:hypothetical protein|uniref:hypothetical protein n=1 Tax=Desulfurella TaxID=33001 RepID=UPI0003E09043|nr:hypothetical protein [Desulfurella multipotens]AHF97988.1 hypothetical protein DESACE_05640 [Desulfurella acetivorans A63]PMP68681.1 MAG: hypothetical protein C0192_01460 [Desulfurella multipotens]
MNICKGFLVLIALFGFVSLAFGGDGVSSRALFFSTAGTAISVPSVSSTKIETTTVVEKHTVTKVTNSNEDYAAKANEFYQKKPYVKKIAQTLQQNIPAGFSIKIEKVTDSGIINVNPSDYKFKTGDKFIVNFQTNLPGIVEVSNISPTGEETKLIQEYVEAFTPIQIPGNGQGEFEFQDSTGVEKLVFKLYSCKNPSKQTYIASRSINIVRNNDNYGKVNNAVFESLPNCKKSYESNASSSRSIVISNNSYVEDASYYVSNTEAGSSQPIVAIVRLIHE